jgi:hypothetical protein
MQGILHARTSDLQPVGIYVLLRIVLLCRRQKRETILRTTMLLMYTQAKQAKQEQAN